MQAKACRHLARRRGRIVPGAPGNALADIHRQRRAALAEHFANEHKHGERRGDKGGAVERQAVAPGDMDRQNRRAVAARELHKPGVPDAVLDALHSGARDFARREENQRAAALQMRFHLFNGGFAGAVAEVIDGDKER